MYITRAIESLIQGNFERSKVLVITGARQVGKTTVTKHLYPNMRRINMKDQFLANVSKEDPLSFLQSFPRPLFIDEIQSTPHLINELKVVLDEVNQKGNYILSGSQKWQLMKGLSESLAGMASILEMTTLSMREIHQVNFNQAFSVSEEYFSQREKELKPYSDLWATIHRGFYPELYDDNPRDWNTYYSDYVSTYIEKDVYDILKIHDSTVFYRFMVACAARTGNVLNYVNIANDIGIDSVTVKSWISVLEKTGIVYLLQPYFNSHLSRAIKSPKLYFRDTGLAAYLTNWSTPDQLKNGALNGAIFETFVVNELIKSFLNAGKDYSRHLYYYRGKDKKKSELSDEYEREIDLIIEENQTLYPIEIKKNQNVNVKMAKAFSVLDKDVDKKRGLGAIICPCEHRIKLSQEVYALPIEYI